MKQIRAVVLSSSVLLSACASSPRVKADVPPATPPAPPAPSVTAAAPAPAPAVAAAPLFDPARHMHVSEVRPGMTGYGLSVFSGTKIERFDVEVISVLRNFNPKYDVVLIRCHGEELEHTGAVAGMSGSPIFLRDDSGHDRMIGAFAYGWPLSKDPVAGVQPIEYMLKLPENAPQAPGMAGPGGGKPDQTTAAQPDETGHPETVIGHPRWSLADCPIQPYFHRPRANELAASGGLAFPAFGAEARTGLGDGQAAPHLQPLATPLMASGLSPELVERLAPMFKSVGLVPLQAGGGTGPGTGTVEKPGEAPPRMEPGGVLAVPLLTGDVELTAIGTVTEVLGERVFGFGHPFNGDGPISLPMGSGTIATVIANLQTSFKLGSLSKPWGTLLTDQQVGVAGMTGPLPSMVPIELHTVYADGSVDQTYHFQMALHPKMTPMVAGAAIGAALTGTKELPQYHTLDYELTMDFANGKTVHVVNKSVNTGVMEVFTDVGLPVLAASENPFRRVPLKKLTGTVRVTANASEARILSVTVPRVKYEPGETLKAFVEYQPFRAAEAMLPVQMEIPRDLPDGTYTLIVSDAQKYFEDEKQAEPFKFTAESIDELFGVINAVTGIRHDALYLRLVRQPDGVAVGRTAMPRLPSSRREVLLNSGRSDVSAFVSSTVKVVPTDVVLSGSAEFTITIDRQGKVETAPKPVRMEAKPNAPAANPPPPPAGMPKVDEPKEPKPKP